MAIQFPNNPRIGDKFTDVDTNITYVWSGAYWSAIGPGTGIGATGPEGKNDATAAGGTC